MDQKQTTIASTAATRRDFIKKTATAAAAVATTSFLRTPVYGQNQAPSANVAGANNRITVGYIGVGSQGLGSHVSIMKAHAAENNIAQAAVCDVWPKRVDAAKVFIEKDNAGAKVETFGDYRKLIERKDIDTVVIATHDPIHAAAIMAAMEAGKHVYCEKPMTRYLDEAFQVYDVVKKTGKVLQIGSQGCSAAGWHKAAELIQAGKIGQLVWGFGSFCRNNRKGEWNNPIDSEATASSVDWASWLGPVKKRIPFNADHYFRWRKYYPYCAGLLGDLVPHRLNPLMLAMGKPEFPSRVVSVGTKNVHTDKNTPGTPERDVPEHLEVLAEFPSGVTLVVVTSTVAAKADPFSLYGHQATLTVGQAGERIELTPQREFADEVDPESFTGLNPIEDIGVHHKNWLDCIRTGKQPNCGIELAVRVQTVISLAELSDRLKITCLFDEKTRKVTTGDGREVKVPTYGWNELS